MAAGMLVLVGCIDFDSSNGSDIMHQKKRKRALSAICSFCDIGTYRNVFMKKLPAFVTLEYTLLLPVIMIFYIVLIYMGLYQHNRCVMQINTYIMATEGSKQYERDSERIFSVLRQKYQYLGKYLLVEEAELKCQLGQNQLVVTESGAMSNPLHVFDVGEAEWSLQAEAKANLLLPIERMRFVRKGQAWLGDLDAKEEENGASAGIYQR